MAPIERPAGFGMKLAYYFTKKQFGKVLTPLKVHAARLPAAFGMFYGKVSQLDKKLLLPQETALLIREWVGKLNICLFCMDAARATAISKNMSIARFQAMPDYKTSSLFSEAQRAALDYATELTKNKAVSKDTFAKLAQHYSEREICEIVFIVASEHLYNLTNLGLNIHSDMLCDLPKSKN